MRQTPGCRGEWQGIKFHQGFMPWADVIVVLNANPRNLYGFFREGGKWIMSQEPPHEFYRWQTKVFSSFDQIFTFWPQADFPSLKLTHTQTSLPWHVGKTYDQLLLLNYQSLNKSDDVTWITSSLNTRPGHAVRLNFMNALNQHQFPYHLMGRGFRPIADKFDGLAPIKYSIAIENFSCADYWTEKIADCFLSWTMPFYYGCTNITDYFPPESMILIDPLQPDITMEIMKEAVALDKWKKALPWIAEARQLILNKYQFFPSVVDKLKQFEIAQKPRRLSFIPKAT